MMNRTAAAVCAAAAGLSCCGCAQQEERLNVVYILADDLGYGDLSAYNPASRIHTPVLDSLAAQGVRFTNAHSTASVSTPTRYGLLTGRYPWRSRLKQGVLWTWADPLITSEPTLPEMMRSMGYATALIGKWHLGIGFPTTDGKPVDRQQNGSNVDYTRPLADGPTHHGFDYYYGDDVPNFPPYAFIENDRFVDIPTKEFPKTGMPGVPGIMSDKWHAEELLSMQSAKSAAYIKAHRNEPFFLLVSLTAPHTPIAPAPEFEGKSGAGRYGDFVQEMDARVGEILRAVDQSGIAGRTIVVFSSDNGSSFQDGGSNGQERYAGRFGSILAYGHNPSGAFRGMKSDSWEGGHRIPFIVRWPRLTDVPRVSDELVCDLDLFATLADALHGSLPQNAAADSRSLLPLLRGAEPLRSDLVAQSGNGVLCYVEANWKLVAGSGSGGSINPFEDTGELPFYDAPAGQWRNVQLYDLSVDPAERHNVAQNNPARVSELLSKLAQRVDPAPGEALWPQVAWIAQLRQTNENL